MKTISAILTTLFLFFAGNNNANALADGVGCAVVKSTPDGFLNLRDESSTSAKIIAKLYPGERIYVHTTEAGIMGVGNWARVEGVWRLDTNDTTKQWHTGYVYRRYIRQIKCPKEMDLDLQYTAILVFALTFENVGPHSVVMTTFREVPSLEGCKLFLNELTAFYQRHPDRVQFLKRECVER